MVNLNSLTRPWSKGRPAGTLKRHLYGCNSCVQPGNLRACTAVSCLPAGQETRSADLSGTRAPSSIHLSGNTGLLANVSAAKFGVVAIPSRLLPAGRYLSTTYSVRLPYPLLLLQSGTSMLSTKSPRLNVGGFRPFFTSNLMRTAEEIRPFG
jgi:hypothetical protein